MPSLRRSSGHAPGLASTRASFSGTACAQDLVTSAAAAGVAEVDIARTSRHRSVPVLRRYVREASVFTRNAAGAVL